MSVHQVVVFGATSFVGQIMCRYLVSRQATSKLRWAMAGRSIGKLEQLRAELGPAANEVPLIVADAADENSLRELCASTDVVASTVGPYALYGSPLVKVCAETGTDYCDLTGEVQWIARMIAEHEQTAKRTGARIVHCCGFDSIPSDLGVHFLQKQAMQKFGQPCMSVKLRVQVRGGFSGGTVASLTNVVVESIHDPALRRLLANPYAICPDPAANTVSQPNVSFAEYDADARSWIAPFVMAGINTRVVFRSNALLDGAYGTHFRYDEAMLTGAGAKGRAMAVAVSAGLGVFIGAIVLSPTRWLLNRFVLPKPGEGPSPEAQEAGFYDYRFFGETDDGRKLRVKVTGDRDPGYGSTGKILGEAAACLAQDVPEGAGGFWTPATLLGDRLVQRLQTHAGLSFEVLE